MSLGPFAGSADDLAPGDRAATGAAWEGFTVESVRSCEDPIFDEAYDRLWREFGPKGEMESRDVIAARLAWDPRRPEDGCSLLYELLVVRRDGETVAVRDHTAIARAADPSAGVIVHLSHVLVEPNLRGSGLASWLRALPVATARRCAALAAESSGRADIPMSAPMSAMNLPVTLVAEMERDDGVTPALVRRLRSYAKAGFSLVDPARVDYHQPDFRRAQEIDASGCRPLRLWLVIRRVGREHEARVAGAEMALLVDSLHAMFGLQMRAVDMDVARRATGPLPAAAEEVALLVPGEALPAPTEGDR